MGFYRSGREGIPGKEGLILEADYCLRIRETDISGQTIIVMVKHNGTMLVPKGNPVLLKGDHVILCSQERIIHSDTIQV